MKAKTTIYSTKKLKTLIRFQFFFMLFQRKNGKQVILWDGGFFVACLCLCTILNILLCFIFRRLTGFVRFYPFWRYSTTHKYKQVSPLRKRLPISYLLERVEFSKTRLAKMLYVFFRFYYIFFD